MKSQKLLRKIVCVILLFGVWKLVGQETLGQFKNTLKTSASNIKDQFPIVDEETGNIAVFIADAKNVYGYKLNEQMEVLQQLSSEEKLRKYKVLMGSSIQSNGDYLIYLSNTAERNFLCVTFSFDSQTTRHKEFTFEDEKEELLKAISNNNQFYILTYHRIDDAIFIYTFDDDGNAQRNQLDFGDFDFFSPKGQKVQFNRLVLSGYGTGGISVMNENDPQSIETVSRHRKIYLRENEIIFTFDESHSFTQVVSLDLSTLETMGKRFRKSMRGVSNREKKSNSYLNGDYLFVATMTRKIYELQIIEYDTEKVVQTYRIERDKPIDFKNTPIIQEGGSFANYRELEKSNKFLRKVYQGRIGISVLQRNNQYELTLGGIVENNTGGMMVPSFGFPAFYGGGIIWCIDPTAFSFNSYISTRSTRIESLFDAQMNHVQGDISINAFDKMDEDRSIPFERNQMVFKYKDFYVKGFYNPGNRSYTFKKYTN